MSVDIRHLMDCAAIDSITHEETMQLCDHINSQAGEIERLREVAVMATDALSNYERMGEVCSFEGQPMIYAETLVEIAEAARAVLSGEKQ